MSNVRPPEKKVPVPDADIDEKKEKKEKPAQPVKKQKKAEKKQEKQPDKVLTADEKLGDIYTRAGKIRKNIPHLADPSTAYVGGPFDKKAHALKSSLLEQASEIKDDKEREETERAINEACSGLIDKGKEVICRPFTKSDLKDNEQKTDFSQIADEKKFEEIFAKLNTNADIKKQGEVKAFTDQKQAELKSLTSADTYKAETEGLHEKLKRRDDASHHLAIAKRHNRFDGHGANWALISPIDLEFDAAKEAYEAEVKGKPKPAVQLRQGEQPIDEAKVDYFAKIIERFKKGLADKQEMVWQLDAKIYDPRENRLIDNPFQIRVNEQGHVKVEYTPAGLSRAGKYFGSTFRPDMATYVNSKDPLFVESRLQRFIFLSEMKATHYFTIRFPDEIKDNNQGKIDRRIERIEANLNAAEKHGRIVLSLDKHSERALEQYIRTHSNSDEAKARIEALKAQFKRVNHNASTRLKQDKSDHQIALDGQKNSNEQIKKLEKLKEPLPEIKVDVKAQEGVAVASNSAAFKAISAAIDTRSATVNREIQETTEIVQRQLQDVKKVIENTERQLDEKGQPVQKETYKDPAIRTQLEDLRKMVVTAQSLCETKEGTDPGPLAKEAKSFEAEIQKHADSKNMGQNEPAQLAKQLHEKLEAPREGLKTELAKTLTEIDTAIEKLNERESKATIEASAQEGRRPPRVR